MAQSAIARLVGLVSQLVLAVLLVPSDFGRIGLAVTVTSLVWTLMNVGIDDVLMRRRDALRLWTGHAFWISMSLSCCAGLVVAAAAPLAALAYHAPDIVGLLLVSALAMPLTALSSVHGLVVRSRMEFRFIAIYGTAEAVAGAVLTIAFAFAGLRAYSFVLPAPILAAVKAVVWWRLAPVRIAMRPRPRRWRYLASDTSYSFAARILHAAVGQGDYVILGLLASQQIVGIYYFGFRFAIQPLGLIVANLTSVLYPALVRFQAEPLRQARAAYAAARLLLFCMMPVAILQAAVAEPLIGLLFGSKWSASVPIIEILSIALAVDSAAWIGELLMNARGEFRSFFLYAAVETPIFVAMVSIGASANAAIGAAWGVCLFYCSKPIFLVFVFRKAGIAASEVARLYVQPILFSLVSVGSGRCLSKLSIFAGRPVAAIAMTSGVGLALYIGALMLFAPEVWIEVVRRLPVRGLRASSRGTRAEETPAALL